MDMITRAVTESELSSMNDPFERLANFYGFPAPPEVTGEIKALFKKGRKLSSKILRVELSPAVCAALVLEHNQENRNIKLTKLRLYCQSMFRGEWKFTDAGISFYPDDILANGQHRLTAAALTGTVLDIIIFFDFERDGVCAIDIGATRTVGDALELQGHIVQHARDYGSVARKLMQEEHQQNRLLDDSLPARLVLTNQEIVAFAIEQMPLLSESMTLSLELTAEARNDNITVVLTLAQMALFYSLLVRAGFDSHRVKKFMADVLNAEQSYENGPEKLLNQVLIQAKSSRFTSPLKNKDNQCRMLIKCFLLALESRNCKKGDVSWDPKRDLLPLLSEKAEQLVKDD